MFEAPFVTTSIFRIDWLHCADQGCAADYLGNILLLCAGKLPGNNLKAKCLVLWGKVQEFYKEESVQDRLQNLTLTMLKQPKKAPKLRASAAQCRALVPFAHKLSQELLSTASPIEGTAKQGMFHLCECYKTLSADCIFAADLLKEHSIRFAQLYVALEAAQGNDNKLWAIKPKLHMFLELCSDGSRPSMCWNYRDEDWGGTVARMSRRRGGILRAKVFSSNLLYRFRLQQPMIRMMEP